ncbi:MAG: hypothetical protein WAK16_08740, partial [Candidatus Cybelea sp.]
SAVLSPSTRFARSGQAPSKDQGDIGAIIPIILGSEGRALQVSEELRKRRIFVPAIRPPTVPLGTSRLRVSVRADHTLEQMDLLAAELQRCIATS